LEPIAGKTVPEKLKILFIHGITEIGGAERELLRILGDLPSLGYHPIVACPMRGPLVEELDRRKIEHHAMVLPPWRKLFAYPKRAAAVRALREVIITTRPQLLHVNDIWWVPQTLRAVAGVGMPIVAHVRQEIDPPKVRRYELNEVDRVFSVSRQIQRSLEAGGVLSERLRVLHSGLELSAVPVQADGCDIRRQFGIPVDVPVIGTVANIFPRKGYEVMLRALPTILKALPELHYLVVGSGNAPYETRLRSLVRELGVANRVHFAGFQASVYLYLAAMDLYVHPALVEGFGIAVLEAMAMRKPVVATATGGLPEIVQDGETGIVVSPGDPDALAQSVSRLLQDSARCRRLGEAGRTRVATHFTVETMMDQLVSGYGALLGRRVSAPQVVSR
jgi:glycosyltransferase involved in cell wall biosynthesis